MRLFLGMSLSFFSIEHRAVCQAGKGAPVGIDSVADDGTSALAHDTSITLCTLSVFNRVAFRDTCPPCTSGIPRSRFINVASSVGVDDQRKRESEREARFKSDTTD